MGLINLVSLEESLGKLQIDVFLMGLKQMIRYKFSEDLYCTGASCGITEEDTFRSNDILNKYIQHKLCVDVCSGSSLKIDID